MGFDHGTHMGLSENRVPPIRIIISYPILKGNAGDLCFGLADDKKNNAGVYHGAPFGKPTCNIAMENRNFK